MRCPRCGSNDYIKKGKHTNGSQRYKCKKCGNRFQQSTATHDGARVLLFDIETAPMESYTWSLYPKALNTSFVIEDWNIICWRAKWLFGDTVLGAVQTPMEAVMRDDRRITKKLFDLFNEADIIIAHNLNQFDKKKANTRFLIHNLGVPSPYQTIDTLLVARHEFSFASNRLDYLCQKLGIGCKLDTGGFDLWKRCLGDELKKIKFVNRGKTIRAITTYNTNVIQQALQKMYVYCEQDTTILEDLYLRLRPWIKSHPNMALYLEDSSGRCGNCTSKNLSPCSHPYYTPTGCYQTFQCRDCGSFVRSRFASKRTKGLCRTLAR